MHCLADRASHSVEHQHLKHYKLTSRAINDREKRIYKVPIPNREKMSGGGYLALLIKTKQNKTDFKDVLIKLLVLNQTWISYKLDS